jgi:hypothetical protein
MSLRGISIATLVLVGAAATKPLPAQTTPVQAVAQLYRDFAWEAVIDEPQWRGHELFQQPRPVLARYFDDNLIALILADRACVARTHEECRLDFVPIWDSQDPGATELKVLPTSDSSVVRVAFRWPPDRHIITLTYHLARTSGGWRIHDIVSANSGSLVALLARR